MAGGSGGWPAGDLAPLCAALLLAARGVPPLGCSVRSTSALVTLLRWVLSRCDKTARAAAGEAMEGGSRGWPAGDLAPLCAALLLAARGVPPLGCSVRSTSA